MHARLIEALLAKNWSYSMIALRAKIDETRLRSGNLGRREMLRLEEMAERDARINIDAVYAEEGEL